MTCARCATALEEHDLRCATCALPVPAVAEVTSEYARLVRCTECAAATAFDPSVQAPRCPFCGHATAIEQPQDPVDVAAIRVPFAVDRVDAEAALRGWLADRGWFAPRALRDEAVFESLAPLYWASWVVDARARVAWAADSDDGARRSAWAPHAGEVELTFAAIVVPASRGLTLSETELLAPHYALESALPIEHATHADLDAPVESFEAQRSAGRAIVTRAIERSARTRIEPSIPGRRYRNVRVACLVEGQTTRRVALPAWVLAYRYAGKRYRAIVHGTRRDVVFGSAPLDTRKVALLVGAALLVLGLIALALAQ